MVFSSVPQYLDHHNWHHQFQQSNHQQVRGGSKNLNFLSSPFFPSPQPGGGGGGGGEGSIRPGSMVDRARLAKLPLPEPGLNCPRCDSTHTKFCYFNNYSLTQPRHFCKMCRRYWTRGGALRNVPVGGGCRRNKRNNKSCRSSKSPNQSGPKSLSASPPRSSSDNITTSHQLPFMSSFSQYSDNISSNIGGFQSQNEMGSFQYSSNGNNFNNILSIGGGESWRLPFLPGFEATNNSNLFHYQSEAPPSSIAVGDLRLKNSEIHNSEIDPPEKTEENRSLNLSKQFLVISENANQQQWAGNTWTELSAVSTSTPTTHFL